MLDDELLAAIHKAGGECQISVWLRRTKSGLRTLRVHIEPPYQGAEPDELDDSEFQGGEPAEAESGLPWS